MKGPGHRQLEHTADVALELWAPTESVLLAEGARAIIELLTEGRSVAASERRSIAVTAVDREDRLVRFLNEILVLAVSDAFLSAEASLELLGDTRLRGELQGERGRPSAELKSVTYHDLALTHGADGWRARIVIDV